MVAVFWKTTENLQIKLHSKTVYLSVLHAAMVPYRNTQQDLFDIFMLSYRHYERSEVVLSNRLILLFKELVSFPEQRFKRMCAMFLRSGKLFFKNKKIPDNQHFKHIAVLLFLLMLLNNGKHKGIYRFGEHLKPKSFI